MSQNMITRPAVGGVAVSAGTPFTACRALNVTTEGAATVTFADGTSATVLLTKGYNPISITNVASAGLTAAGIVALY